MEMAISTKNLHQVVAEQLANLLVQPAPELPIRLNEALRLLAKYRSQLICNTLLAEGGNQIRSGPFKGMLYNGATNDGSACARLLGCYESELHPVLDDCLRGGYELLLNIGCSDGYYATGMALANPNWKVVAYDSVPRAQELCRRCVRENGVADRVDVKGEFTAQEFDRYDGRNALVICDIEGAEDTVLNPLTAPSITGFDILVELHHFPDPGIPERVLRRFETSHEIQRISVGSRDVGKYRELENFAHLDQLLAMWEWRSSPTPWAFLRQRPTDASLDVTASP